MSNPNPMDEVNKEISSLQTKVANLHTRVRLTSLRDQIATITVKATAMEKRVGEARKRNYIFERDLEKQAADMAERWVSFRPSIETQLLTETNSLRNSMTLLESEFNRLVTLKANPDAARSLADQFSTKVINLENKITVVENFITGMFDPYKNELNIIDSHLVDIEWMLTQLEEASFKLLNSEATIMAVKATLVEGNEEKDDPQGVLYLTDQRLLFEQKQKIATKKVLFITTDSETVQKLIFETPIVSIIDVISHKEGMFKNEDHIEVKMDFTTAGGVVHLHLFGQDCKLWQGLIKRAKNCDFDQNRMVTLSQDTGDKIKQIPTECPKCGGAFTQSLLRGQETIQCEYCGHVIRL